MLIKHQSFEISQRRKSQKRKRSDDLYEAKKYPYLKFILIPGIIGFMLLCILVNVKFASQVEKPRENVNTTAGVGDNVDLKANATEFWMNENESESESSSHENPKDTKGSKQNVLVDRENRVTVKEEISIQQQQRDIETRKVLPTEFGKPYDDDGVDELTRDATEAKSKELNSNTVKFTPALETHNFVSHDLKRIENEILKIFVIPHKSYNRAKKHDKPPIFNTKFKILRKEFSYKSQEPQSIETIFNTSKARKIASASRKPTFPVVNTPLLPVVDTITNDGNSKGVPSSKIPHKGESTVNEGKSKIGNARSLHSSRLTSVKQPRSFSDHSPAQVGNARSSLFLIPNTRDNLRVGNSVNDKQQQEYKNSCEKQHNKLKISIKLLQNFGSENVKEISQEIGNARVSTDVGSYQPKRKNAAKPTNNGQHLFDSEHNSIDADLIGNAKISYQPTKPKPKNAAKPTNNGQHLFDSEHNSIDADLIGNAIILTVVPVTVAKDERSPLQILNENKPNEIETNLDSEEHANDKYPLKEKGNEVKLKARQVISKGFDVSKLPGPNRYGEDKNSDRITNQKLAAVAIHHTLNEPIPYHFTKVKTVTVGNSVPKYLAKAQAQYNKDFVKMYNSQRDKNVIYTNPHKPESLNVNEIPRRIANHFTESTAMLDAVLKETPHNQFSNSLTSEFKTAQTDGSTIMELPTKLKVKEKQYYGPNYYKPNEYKYFGKQIQIQNNVAPEVGNILWQLKSHMIESNAQYSETTNNLTTTISQHRDAKDTPQPIEPRQLGNHNKTQPIIEHIPLEINILPAAGNTVTKFLNQPKHRRTARQLESGLKVAVAPIKCQRFPANCTMTCDTGSLGYLGDDLEDFQIGCYKKDLTLELRNCVFDKGIMKYNFLNGFYSLQELQIINCNLTTIHDGAFKGRGVTNLQTLKFVDNSIALLTATTFDGLTVLKHFELSQRVVGDKSVGENFLAPIASTLTNVKIMQMFDNNAIVDPTSWLQGPDFVALYIVNLENNNLQGILKPETFKSLTAVGTINLQNCSLDTIDINPFALVLDTLYILYLNNNFLLTLDPMFLDHLKENQVVLSAKGNYWQCDCDHRAMIEYLKYENENQYINMEDFFCKSPSDLLQTNMVNVTLNCEAAATTVGSSEQSDTTPSKITHETESSSKSTTQMATSPTTTTATSQKTDEIHSSSKSTTEVATLPTTVTLDATTLDSTTDMATSPTADSFDPTTSTDTTIPTNLENITCRSHESTDLLTISLKTRTADLTIRPSTSTSVTIISSIDSLSYRIAYFVKYTQYSLAQPTSSTQWTINNLNEKQTYMFCLVPDTDNTVSPFDCWGHFMGNSRMNGWLLASDKGWFISVVIIAAVLFCVIGGAVVYFVLCQRPAWILTSNERMLKVHQSSHKVVLLPKRSSIIRRVSSTSDLSPHYQTTRASYLSPEPQCDRYSSAPSHVYTSLNKPPTECAPTLPGVVNGNPCSSSFHLPRAAAHHNNVVTRQLRWPSYAEDNDYGYNTIDHYEEVKF